MPAKKFKDGVYYWVRRKPTHSGEGVSVYPKPEPMLWDAKKQAFYQAGLGGQGIGHATTALAHIGDEIAPDGAPKRTKRLAWAPAYLARGERLLPDLLNITTHRQQARDESYGAPLRVEVSWENHHLSVLRGKVRESRRPENL